MYSYQKMTNPRMLAIREKSFDKKKKTDGFSACLVKGMSPLPVAGKLKIPGTRP